MATTNPMTMTTTTTVTLAASLLALLLLVTPAASVDPAFPAMTSSCAADSSCGPRPPPETMIGMESTTPEMKGEEEDASFLLQLHRGEKGPGGGEKGQGGGARGTWHRATQLHAQQHQAQLPAQHQARRAENATTTALLASGDFKEGNCYFRLFKNEKNPLGSQYSALRCAGENELLVGAGDWPSLQHNDAYSSVAIHPAGCQITIFQHGLDQDNGDWQTFTSTVDKEEMGGGLRTQGGFHHSQCFTFSDTLNDQASSARTSDMSTPCQWRQTGDRKPDGPREPGRDRGCRDPIPKGHSGFCDCDADGQWDEEGLEKGMGFGTDKSPGTCKEKCGATGPAPKAAPLPAQCEGGPEACFGAEWCPDVAGRLTDSGKCSACTMCRLCPFCMGRW